MPGRWPTWSLSWSRRRQSRSTATRSRSVAACPGRSSTEKGALAGESDLAGAAAGLADAVDVGIEHRLEPSRLAIVFVRAGPGAARIEHFARHAGDGLR